MKRENAAKRYYKRALLIYVLISIPVILLFFLFAIPYFANGDIYSKIVIFPIVYTVVIIPFIIYYLVKFIHYSNVIFINIKKGKVVNSESFNYGRYGTYVGFVVEYEDEIGDKHRVTTKHCHRRADGYFGVTVTVGQDPSTGEWIILE